MLQTQGRTLFLWTMGSLALQEQVNVQVLHQVLMMQKKLYPEEMSTNYQQEKGRERTYRSLLPQHMRSALAADGQAWRNIVGRRLTRSLFSPLLSIPFLLYVSLYALGGYGVWYASSGFWRRR